MTEAIAFSDAHIHDDQRLEQISALCSYVEMQKPQLLVLVGDIADPWQADWGSIKRTRTWRRLSDLCDARSKAGLKTVYVLGNHDQNAGAGVLRGVEIGWQYRWKHGRRTWFFTHGSEWDPVWGGPFGQALYWLATRMPSVAKIVSKLYSLKAKGSTPGTMKGKGYKDDWTQAAESLHGKAREYARRKRVFVVLGHTHCPWTNELIADAGDWEDSFSIVQIADSGKAALKHLVNGVMTDL